MICPTTKAIHGLRRNRTEDYYYPADNGFIPQEEERGSRECGPTAEEMFASNVLEGLTRYLSHDIGCVANDLDYLDDAPCTCGLRKFYNPKGV